VHHDALRAVRFDDSAERLVRGARQNSTDVLRFAFHRDFVHFATGVARPDDQKFLKLVSNPEELIQRLVSNDMLPRSEQEQISQWLMLKQECEDCLSENSEPHRSLERIEEEIEGSYESSASEAIEEEEKESLSVG
jgi:hypothetical protein